MNSRAIRILVPVLLVAMLASVAMIFHPSPVAAQFNRPGMPWKSAPISFASSGNNTVVAAATGNGICVYELYFVVAGATNITIKDGASTSFSGAMSFLANGSLTFGTQTQALAPWWQTSKGNAFVINSSNAVQVSGEVKYAPCVI